MLRRHHLAITLLALLLALAGYNIGSATISAVERILDNAATEAVAEMIGG